MFEFIDAFGKEHQLIKGFRTRVFPGWEKICDFKYELPSFRSVLLKRLSDGKFVLQMLQRLGLYRFRLLNSELLEFGCYDGSLSYMLSILPINRIVASDVIGYYVNQRNSATPERQRVYLDELKTKMRFGRAKKIEYVEDDITCSKFDSSSFDFIISREVLEHVPQYEQMFKEISRLLRPGGITYHEYNPFFSITGGHSLCTLDIPWGHARLNEVDFERYLDCYRLSEKNMALQFYKNNLNRMRLFDLHSSLEAAGLQVLKVWGKYHSRWKYVSQDVVDDVKRIYGSVDEKDLLFYVYTVMGIKR